MHCQRNLRIIYVNDLHPIEDGVRKDETIDSTEFDMPGWPLDHISSNSKFFVMNNPSRKADDPAYFFYYQNDIPIARLSTFADTLVVGRSKYRWGWTADLKVQQEFRGQGIATAFIKAVLEHMNHIGWVYGGLGIAFSARKIYRKLNFIDIGRIPRYVRLLSPNPVINLLRARGYVARVLALPITQIPWLLRPRGTESEEISEEVRIFDQDLLPTCMRAQSKISFLRTPDILNWKLLLASKSRKFRYRAFQLRVSSKMIGWFVARFAYFPEYPNHTWIKRITVCTILEAGMDPDVDNRWDRFVNLAIRTAMENDADALEIYSSDPLFQRALRRRLFKRIGGQDFMFRPPDGTSLPIDSLRNRQEWTLLRGDSDGFYCI